MQIEKLSPSNRKRLLQRLLYRAFVISILTAVLAPMCYLVKEMKELEFAYKGFWYLISLVCLIAFTMPLLDLFYNKKRIVHGKTMIHKRNDGESGVYYVLEISTDDGYIQIVNDEKCTHIIPQTIQTIHYARFSKIIFQVDTIEIT